MRTECVRFEIHFDSCSAVTRSEVPYSRSLVIVTGPPGTGGIK